MEKNVCPYTMKPEIVFIFEARGIIHQLDFINKGVILIMEIDFSNFHRKIAKINNELDCAFYSLLRDPTRSLACGKGEFLHLAQEDGVRELSAVHYGPGPYLRH